MCFFLFGFALAHESTPQNLTISDQLEFFNGIEVDSGWVPNNGIMGIRLQVVADGGADIRMEGEGTLRWPDELNFSAVPKEEGGYIALNSEISTIISIRFDIAGYQWESDIATSTTSFFTEKTFEPYLLSESIEVESDASEQQIIEYDYNVLPGVSVGFNAELHPYCKLVFSGEKWDVDGQSLFSPNDTASWPPDGSSALETQATYIADVAAELEMDFVPVLEVCVPLFGCYDWDVVEFPLTTITDDYSHGFPAVDLHFPLPIASASVEEIDFGTIVVGELANWELSIENLGELYLDGELRVLGDSDSFPLFPDTIYAMPSTSDGVMISFAPMSEGEFSATLQLISNDPYQSVIEIPIMGTAIADIVDTNTESDDSNGDVREELSDEKLDGKESEVIQDCGCSASTGPFYPSFLLLVLVGYRRRT